MTLLTGIVSGSAVKLLARAVFSDVLRRVEQ